ncbi:NUDIX hydrolase [Raoultella sp. Ech2A]|uniref:NUDIX hydrolase n=1 Tax=Raoultella sp. Ech2A TaxID=2996539 RepID=UPI0024C08F59|nr:NUDIX hydrolase [Raoultella sp. Ech2A]MDJ1654375.1 NUDIX hydrolase [Raoultella sp. Ech2A]
MKKRLTADDMHDAEVIADTPWFSMRKVAIDVTADQRRDFYSIHYPRPAVGIVAMQQGKVLLIRHYRYLIDQVVWAIPSGGIDEGEEPREAALRELREETGWQAKNAEEIIRYNPSYGSSDQLFITWLARDLEYVGMDADQDEVMETGWFTFEEIRELIARGEMPDGLSLVPLLHLMAQQRGGLA